MTNPNDMAFPVQGHNYVRHGQRMSCPPEDGLTKREYFAAMAMQGLCANESIDVLPGWREGRPARLAESALEYADALIAQLAVKEGTSK